MWVLPFWMKKMTFWFVKRRRNEQILLTALSVLAWYFLWDSTVQRWQMESLHTYLASNTQLETEVLNTEMRINQFNTQSWRATFEALKQKVLDQEREAENLQAQIQSAREQATSSQELIQLLKTVVRQSKDIRLVSIEGLPALRADTGTDTMSPTSQTSDPPQTPQLWKPGLKLVLEGRYFQMMLLLKSLEESKWRIYWEKLVIEQKSYPVSTLTLMLRTLSTEKH